MYHIELVQIHEGVSINPEHEFVVDYIKCNVSFVLPLSRSDARAIHIEDQVKHGSYRVHYAAVIPYRGKAPGIKEHLAKPSKSFPYRQKN